MPDRFRIKRYKTSLTIPVGLNTITSANIPDVNINGLLRGVIVNVSTVDTALIAVSDTVTTNFFIDVDVGLTRAIAVVDGTTTSENIGINHAG